jgi:transposase
MIRILDKNSIKKHILPNLSKPRRGGGTHQRWEIVNAILYKLKTGVQWELLPVKSLIYKAKVKWGSIYHHFRKWVKDGSWSQAFTQLISDNKGELDLSVAQLDGTHTRAKKGGQQVAFQDRKKASTTNTLWLTDRQGLVVSFTQPLAGNHHDSYQIEQRLDSLVEQMNKSGVDGLWVNADSGFDSKAVRSCCIKHGIELNAPENQPNKGFQDSNNHYFDELMYQERFVIERTNAWADSYRTLLVRDDTSNASWTAWHYLFAIIQWCNFLDKL